MTSQSAATLRSRYVDQAASDLEENRERQRELTHRLAVLKQEEALLLDILKLAEQYEGFADSSRLPEQSQDEPVVAKTKRAPGTAGSRRPAPARSAPKDDATKAGAAGKAHRPLLGDLLTELLDRHDEPRLAKELREELLEKHPDRNPTPQVVRNTLEALVAKGRIQRHKQQRSVLYTPVTPHRKNTSGADG
ncbi:BlaI/MecI/CopY family transcriptional regulator [Streptomyces roseirectus]|uniref:BlaI/MecI/CopY family transcriptional regulator n=1 Tax=Streptomyces roseirectus TaxID=2768066 RepID=A0A7H0IRQ0_9ACTN|nr:BlaI/MecI/CopY family transcriptional regulator [Streptomyces roseirectus]QNP75466.1 BlaI/MecI/CopY family transcriptional regulator [Streptomyces roseirectus]